MTTLQSNALARCPLNESYVEELYKAARGDHVRVSMAVYRAMLESHERLRAENVGVEVLLADADKEIKRLRADNDALRARNELLAARLEEMEGVT